MSICSSFLSSRTSLLPSLSVNLPPRRRCTYRRERERKRGSRVEWKQDAGSIYRLLSSDAPGITFVRFAGVDDVVAHGVGVISTREGTYLPITVPLVPSFLRAHTHTSAPPRPFSSLLPSLPLFPRRRPFHAVSLYLFPPAYILRSFVPRYSLTVNFARIPGLHESARRALDFYLYPNLYSGTSGARVHS